MSQDYKNIPLTIDIEREKLTFSKTPKLQVNSQTKRQKSFPREYTSPNFVKPFNQGVLGSCVGCSGKIIVTDEFSTEDLSALWIYNKAKKYDVWEGENYAGTSIAGACQSLIKEGVCLEKFMPYVPKENVEPEFGAEHDASKRKFTNFYAIGIDNIDQVKQMIYDGKKLWTSFIVHEGFYEVYKGYINEKDYLKGQQKGGHAVALVGWKEIRGKLFWRFQNSWGDNWGDKGFFYVSHALYSEIVNSTYAIFRTETTDVIIDDSDDISTSKKRNPIVRILTSIVNIITKMFKR